MGKRVIYTCDRCGLETASYLDLEEYILPVWFTAHSDLGVHLCTRCCNELNELLRKYYMRPEERAGNVEQPLPDEVIEGWKELVEDKNHDIIELEEELERLRDVKDKLFETNFKLTAQLRALGVEVDDENEEEAE